VCVVHRSLRDQVLYPRPPAAVWAASPPEARAAFTQLIGPGAGQVSPTESSSPPSALSRQYSATVGVSEAALKRATHRLVTSLPTANLLCYLPT
jgi:hypothetical protein